MQKNWIGKSEGCEIDFITDFKDTKLKIFTTRPDTIFGASFIGIAHDHPFTENLKDLTIDFVRSFFYSSSSNLKISSTCFSKN